jgi:hypothetical protein
MSDAIISKLSLQLNSLYKERDNSCFLTYSQYFYETYLSKTFKVWIDVVSMGNFGHKEKKKASLPSHFNPKSGELVKE